MRAGQMVSVWERVNKRHKWRMTKSMVRLLFFDGLHVTVQVGDEDERTGPTSFQLKGSGTWEKELRAPVKMSVIKRGKK